MIGLYQSFKLRWLIGSVCLASAFLIFTEFARASTTPPPPPPGVTSSITRTDNSSQPAAPAFSGCGGADQAAVNADFEQQVVDLVNTERAKRGLPPYKRNTDLDRAARYHAADMGQDNYFDHDTYDRSGSSLVFVCNTWTRIGKYYTGALGENIAAGYATPASVMNGWMNSTGHRNNILSTNNWEIGVGYANWSGSDYYHYWTQDFGRRDGSYPLIINRDAASTATRGVSLYLYGSFQQMRLKNDGDAWGAWQTFSNNRDWVLKDGVGTHTVSVELKSGSTVVPSSDTIYLSQPDPPQLGNLPSAVVFLYSIPEGRLVAPALTLQPASVTWPDALTWSV
ncbi:MAG TPA: CAP domain-containing protein, partial [Anaerolineae bacterium]|nr:CAP domain-containing protein [Anaerolineae bacterium]